jgi:hypothetical protein
MNVLIGLLLFAYVSAKLSDGLATLYPGYVINFKTPKNKVDDHYAFVPLTTVGADTNYLIAMKWGLHIDAAVGLLPPTEYVYLSNRNTPSFASNELILNNNNNEDDSKTSYNMTNSYYWLGGRADCTGTVSTCKNDVEAEVSLWTVLNNDTSYHWPPYQIRDQRRTAKFTLPYQKWLYFWLTVTNDNLDSNGIFNLYLGVQFYGGTGSSSAVQMSRWKPTDPWPTAAINGSQGSLDHYPLSPLQKDDWIQEAPWAIEVGMWKVAAQSTVNNDAKFTVKAGFNAPPKQAAVVNASFNRFGLLALVTLCIMKHLF